MSDNLEVVSIDDFMDSLKEMTVEELETVVSLCTQVIEDKKNTD